MKSYDEIEQEGFEKSKKKKPKMKVTGKSVFLISKEILKPKKKSK